MSLSAYGCDWTSTQRPSQGKKNPGSRIKANSRVGRVSSFGLAIFAAGTISYRLVLQGWAASPDGAQRNPGYILRSPSR